MPVYKTEAFIEETIQSVIAQTYKNVELVCVNDCTPDGAFEICKQYSERYGFVKLCANEKNSGLEATRNHGLDEATGDYVMFLDSDDTIRPEMIEKMVSSAEENGSDVVMSAYSMHIEEQDIPVLAGLELPPVITTTELTKILLSSLEWKIFCCVGTKLYRRKLIEDRHLRFDKQYKYNEDGGFILSFLKTCEKISYIDEPFYRYRIRQSGSIMSSYRKDPFSSISKVNELLRDLFVQHGVFEEKKGLYYRKLLFVMIDSLRNEAKFGSKDTFRQVVQQIKGYRDYADMEKVLRKSKIIGTKQKFALTCLHYNLVSILYRML